MSGSEVDRHDIAPSPELVAVVTRWMRARERRDVRTLANLFLDSDHLRYIGTDADELFEGRILHDGYGAHVEELPPFVAECDRIEAFEAGGAGWAAWFGRLIVEGREAPLPIRFSWVLILDDGFWKIAHTHVSYPRPNMEMIGRRHSALLALAEAARKGEAAFEEAEEGTATILFTDVVNSTFIAAAMGDRPWSRRIQDHLQEVTEIVEAQGGRMVKTLGDGTMSSFRSARAALRAAGEVMRRAERAAAEPALLVRAGLHSGDVIPARGDFFGTVVNKAARIAALAEPGGVLVSAATREMVGGGEFRFDGPVTLALRGIEEAQAIFRLLWAAEPESGSRAG